jgi:hypothetical protein
LPIFRWILKKRQRLLDGENIVATRTAPISPLRQAIVIEPDLIL